jgi:spore photoproduct lyase
MQDSAQKFQKACEQSPFESLHEATKEFVRQKSHSLSFSQIREFATACVDLQMWGFSAEELWRENLKEFFEAYENIKNSPKIYTSIKEQKQNRELRFVHIDKDIIGFGRCPVASPKTRCCNLLTLDAIEGCAYGCSYCSIQTFYDGNISVNRDFASKLSRLRLDKSKIYHIGTGQSSDSLMIGDKDGILEALIDFARENPNVILEFKSKSANINALLKAKLPPNIICTFSLNPQIVVDNEEYFTASVEKRIEAAAKLAHEGILVGFHFHPMVWFEGWQKEYESIASKLIQKFKAEDTALVSMGTLTFTKPVLKQIRQKAEPTKILQMPLYKTNGKFSYPLHIKKQMFGVLYKAFESWHDKVFFYLCMEDESLWRDVFGFEYDSNEAFEEAMKRAYMSKIDAKSKIEVV